MRRTEEGGWATNWCQTPKPSGGLRTAADGALHPTELMLDIISSLNKRRMQPRGYDGAINNSDKTKYASGWWN